MGESLSAWLSLREEADVRARSERLTREVANRIDRRPPLHLVDLASGTGSNIRYLAPRLPGPQQWLAVDRDASLLEEGPRRLPLPFDFQVVARRAELGTLAADLFHDAQLVTASALLDLVSGEWIGALAARCRDARAAVLFALTYDGRSTCVPQEPEDDAVREWFNAHQRANDKGFGRAAGPDASQAAVRMFRAAGYDVLHEQTDWVLTPDLAPMQRVLIEGWADAATEIVPGEAALIASWRARRLAHVDAGRSRIVVGHEDVAGWLR